MDRPENDYIGSGAQLKHEIMAAAAARGMEETNRRLETINGMKDEQLQGIVGLGAQIREIKQRPGWKIIEALYMDMIKPHLNNLIYKKAGDPESMPLFAEAQASVQAVTAFMERINRIETEGQRAAEMLEKRVAATAKAQEIAENPETQLDPRMEAFL